MINKKALPGIALAAALAAAGMAAAELPFSKHLGLSGLTLAIIAGILAGNTFFPRIANSTAQGVDFSKSTLLRAGIIFFGFRISFQQILQVGWAGALIDLVMISLTFLLALYVGRRVFGLDRQTAMLIGAGSAICGAAAVLATEPVVKGQAHKVSVAVATVVVFGTLSMFLYPILYPHLGLSEQAYGIYAGSTIHEVAQVVAAGNSISEHAADTAVIEKMLRVMMLAPFLLMLSSFGEGEKTRKISIPWFAVFFIVASAVNSLHILPQSAVKVIEVVDTVLLATAMAALGLRTHVGAIRQAGLKPLGLAAVLFTFLITGGYAVNRIIMHFMA
ncbi:MAG TPA: YeiH family protein [Burkholderiales bacterium]|nr:YeiH family protein [Burkholderiales bacterium]